MDISMDCPALIIHADYGIFSIKENRWLYRDLNAFPFFHDEDEIPAYYELKRNKKVGFIDAEGKELIPIEVEDFCYCNYWPFISTKSKWKAATA